MQNAIKKTVIGQTILGGFVLGIPISYWFQSEYIRRKASLLQYLQELPKLLDDLDSRGNQEVFMNVVLSCLVCSVIGGFIGLLLDKNQPQNNNFVPAINYDLNSEGTEYASAPLVKRIFSGVIDILCISLVSYIIGEGFLPHFIIGIPYYFLRDQFLKGGIGKQLTQLMVISVDGNSIQGNWKKGIMRGIFLSFISPIEGILLLLTGKTLGDRIAGTLVVEKNDFSNNYTNLQSNPNKDNNDNDVYTQLERLASLKEKGILNEVEFEKEKLEIMKKLQ
jgi:hypothetical protein